jgi:Ca2+-binding EF-hand superfamily protein
LADRLAAGLSDRFFARWDANGDGVLDSSEVRAMLTHLRAEALGEDPAAFWIQPEDEEVSRVFARVGKATADTLDMAGFQRWWVEQGGWEHVRDPQR